MKLILPIFWIPSSMSFSQVFSLQKPKSFQHSIHSLCSSCFLHPDSHPRLACCHSTSPAVCMYCTPEHLCSESSGEQNPAVSDSTYNMSQHSYSSLMLRNMMAKVITLMILWWMPVCRRARGLPIQKHGYLLYLTLILILSLLLLMKFQLSNKALFFRKERNNTPGDWSDLFYIVSSRNKSPEDICQKRRLCRLLDTHIWKLKNSSEIRSI